MRVREACGWLQARVRLRCELHTRSLQGTDWLKQEVQCEWRVVYVGRGRDGLLPACCRDADGFMRLFPSSISVKKT